MTNIETGTEHLRCEVADGVAVITLDRPEAKNAVNAPMWQGLQDCLAAVEVDPAVRCVVLTGAGDVFCAGGDVKSMAATHANGPSMPFDERVHNQRLLHRNVSGALFSMPKPTVAVMDGAAAGAGMAMALACDMRILSDRASFVPAFARVGLAGDFGGSWFLTQLVGPAKAKELYLLGDRVGAEAALKMGLANRVVPSDDLEQEWREFSRRLATGPPVAYRYMIENINRSVTADLGTMLDVEAMHHRQSATTEDHKGAVKAFVDKETPSFKGR